MSKPLSEQIKEKAKKPFKICYKCYLDLEAGKISQVPDCCNNCELFKEWVKLDDVLALVDARENKLQELAKNKPITKRCHDGVSSWREYNTSEVDDFLEKFVELLGESAKKEGET